MRLKIFLDVASYDCLRKYHSSDVTNVAVLLGSTWVIDCDDMEARELLLVARSHCPNAVDRIAEAIRTKSNCSKFGRKRKLRNRQLA